MMEDSIIARPHVHLHTHYNNIETYTLTFTNVHFRIRVIYISEQIFDEKEINLYLFK